MLVVIGFFVFVHMGLVAMVVEWRLIFFFLCGFDGCDGGDGGGLLAMVVVWFFNFLFSMGLVAVVVMVVVVVDW